MKRLGWLGLLAIALAGCGGDKVAGGGGEAKKFTIAVVPKGTMHEFWKSVRAGAVAAGKELGADIIWKGPLMENDLDDQIKVVENFTSQKVSGIVLAPLDSKGMRVPVKNAQEGGVPVLIIDSALDEVETTSFVATDNYAGGKKAGEEMLKLMPTKVIVMRYIEGSASTMEREKGFLDAVKASSKVTILSEDQRGGATTDTAQKVGESLIQRFRNPDGTPQFDAVYCPNESTTAGMLRALQDAGLAGKVKFIGFDASEKLIQGLKDGQINGLIVQNPFNMGYLGVKNMVAHLKGETVEKRIDTGATFVTKANMTQPDIAKLIAPPSE